MPSPAPPRGADARGAPRAPVGTAAATPARFRLAVFVGRFQPFHAAHLAVVREALSRADHLLVLVGSASGPRTHRNPFTADERASMVLGSLRADELARVAVRPLPDRPYDDEGWIADAQAAVAARCAELGVEGPSRRSVALAGHGKDGTSYYLRRFPQWSSVRCAGVPGISGSAIREALFRPTAEARRWLRGEEGAALLPTNVAGFLDRFLDRPDHAAVLDEFEHVRRYRAQWASAPFPPFFVTVDAVVVQSGHVLLVRRAGFPGRGLWALPGGFVREDERLEDAVLRELREETRLRVPLPVLRGCVRAARVFDDPHRSSRGRTITHAYLLRLPADPAGLPEVRAASDAREARWVPLSEVRDEAMFEDHAAIVRAMTPLAGSAAAAAA